MSYALYRCPTPGCARTERAARPPHWNPCPACRQPVGLYVRADDEPSSASSSRPPPSDFGPGVVTFADAGVP